MRTRIVLAVLIFIALAEAFHLSNKGVQAQSIQSWKIWEDHDDSLHDGNSSSVTVYKIQDGSCSIYVAVPTYPNNPSGIAMGQGCK